MQCECSVVPLGELCEPERGITYCIVKVGDFVPEGVPVIRGGDIRDGQIDVDHAKRVSVEVSNQFQRTILKGGEIVINLIAEPGHTAIVPKRFAGYNVSRDVGVIALNDAVNHRFVDYVLKSPQCISWLTGRLQGSVTQKINLSTLREFPVTIPRREIQDWTVGVLGSLDDKIELNRRMNATLEAMARGLFQSWFVDFDPVRAKLEGRLPAGIGAETAALFPATIRDSLFGLIPEGWEAVPIYETANFINGAAFRSEDFCAAGEGLPVIKIAELKDGITPQTRWSQRQASPDQMIDTGELLYSWSGSPDTSLDVFLWPNGPGLLNQHIFKVIAPNTAQKRFVYYLLKHLRPVLVEIARNKQTTGLGHVTVADMKRLFVCLPSKNVLFAFDKLIGPVFDRVFANALEIQTLATLRDMLLPKLLGGGLKDATYVPTHM